MESLRSGTISKGDEFDVVLLSTRPAVAKYHYP